MLYTAPVFCGMTPKTPEFLKKSGIVLSAFQSKNLANQRVQIERLDHLGIISGVIDDLNLVDMIDSRIASDSREKITCGEAVKVMILSGLGFSNRPVSLTPKFLETKPLSLLFKEGVEAEHFNRFKLGRSLDDLHDYGCDLLFSELSLSACNQEQVDTRFQSLDTTNFSLEGDYLPEEDDIQTVHITYGHSKAHRPDLKQVCLELIASQDGGIPLFSKSWDGNASDNVIFEKRASSLIDSFKKSPTSKYLIMDSKAYTKNNAKTLNQLKFITRVPQSLTLASSLIHQSLNFKDWTVVDENYKYQLVELGHYEMNQRWVVIFSQHAYEKAIDTVKRAQEKRKKAISTQLFHLQARRFENEKEACQALEKLVKTWPYHKIDEITLTRHKQYECRGKPSKDALYKTLWQINGSILSKKEEVETLKKYKACFILASNTSGEELTPPEILSAYKKQSCVENGFRFLKDPLFFVSSLFLKKASRIESLLMIMTLALLVYSIAQRRLRKTLQSIQETLPNQIGIPTENPTLRWIFQLMDGVHCVTFNLQGETTFFIEGLNDIRIKIISLFGTSVAKLYQLGDLKNPNLP
jgi:transposase